MDKDSEQARLENEMQRRRERIEKWRAEKKKVKLIFAHTALIGVLVACWYEDWHPLFSSFFFGQPTLCLHDELIFDRFFSTKKIMTFLSPKF